MAGGAREIPVNYVALAEFLSALGSPVRLELLRRLQFPQTLSEIRLRPYRADPGSNPDRVIARQTVQGHLTKLVEMGLVQTRPVERGGRSVPEYVVNPSRLYVLMEELRTLSTLYAGRSAALDPTGTVADVKPPPAVTGPRLVLVHGVYEGKAYPLERGTASDGAWTIGRADDVAVPLTYDPYVSARNAEVTKRFGRFSLRPMESKNGTSVNWVPLEQGSEHVLRPGDVIGVGRSLLSFVPA